MNKPKRDPDDPRVPIDKYVPYFPSPGYPSRNKKYPWAEMEVGDSFVHGASKYTAATSAAKEGGRLGRKFACKLQPDGKVRIWRLK
jgi:hypothetical protein